MLKAESESDWTRKCFDELDTDLVDSGGTISECVCDVFEGELSLMTRDLEL